MKSTFTRIHDTEIMGIGKEAIEMIKNYCQKPSGPHSLQSKVESMRLFEEALKDSRVVNNPGEKIKTSNWGKKSYKDNRLSFMKLY